MTNKKEASGATHRVARPFQLGPLSFEPQQELNWDGGVLRLPPQTIQKLVNMGMLDSLDPISEARRDIDRDAASQRSASEDNMRLEIGRNNEQLQVDGNALRAQYPARGSQHDAQLHGLQSTTNVANGKAQEAHKSRLKSIDAAAAERKAALK